MKTQRRKSLLVIGPIPPPYHGVTLSIPHVLANQTLRARFDVQHLDTSDHRDLANLGRWELGNVVLALRNILGLLRHVLLRRGVVYIPLSQNTAAFMRDSVFVSLASALRWRVAAHLHGSDFRSFYDGASRPMRWWVRSTLGRFNSVAVMGDSLGWVVDGLVPSNRVAIVWNGTEDPDINGVERDEHTVVFLGNLMRRKGVVEAVEAAKLVLRECPAAKFRFAGLWEDGELRSELAQGVKSFEGSFEFLALTTSAERDRFLGSATVMLFPPVGEEGHPRVIIEALAAGLPIVSTARGAIAETVIDGECGFVLDDPVPSLLADKVVLLLKDRELRARMSSAARARFLARYTQAEADRVFATWLVNVAAADADTAELPSAFVAERTL